MKNYIKSLIITIILAGAFVFPAFGKDNETYVRIRIRYPRLYNEQTTLEGYNTITVYNEKDEFALNEILNARIDSYYAANYYITDDLRAVYGPYHVVLNNEVFNTYEEANSNIEQNDYVNAYPYLTTEGYIISFGNYKDKNSAGKTKDRLNDYGLEPEIINGNYKNIIIYDKNNEPVFMYSKDMPVFLTSFNERESYEMIKIDNNTYRGRVKLCIIDDIKLLTLNYVELENYLYGVVPNEIPSSWGIEALKAQALAARTYAVYNTNPKQQYDMEDNQNSQVYMGYTYEKPSTTKAVDATAGEMIYYDDTLIQAFYHSTSGGMTENSENVWFEALPYLRGVNDEYSDNSGSPHTYWQSTFYKEDIITKLCLDGNDVNELYGIEIKKVSENNRVIECIFSTDAGEISYKKENLRLLIGLKSSWFSIANGNSFYFINEFIPSKNETAEIPSRGIMDDIIENKENKDNDYKFEKGSITGKYAITDGGAKKFNKEKLSFISSKGVSVIDTDSNQYNFEGRGWGHGIGMSQYGAKQMAEEGYTYDEIIKHYYTGVTIDDR